MTGDAASAHDHYWAVCVIDESLADRAQQHPGEALASSMANDEKIAFLGPFDQDFRRAAFFDGAAHVDGRFPHLKRVDEPFEDCQGILLGLGLITGFG